jgi:hypothetical protein
MRRRKGKWRRIKEDAMSNFVFGDSVVIIVNGDTYN